ncbi:MAG: nucleotidyltransferase domain-containing protein, partial [Gammaproteobacteria bacterium]|nr:nucleotidyltransferase domain-containing protein [Gammaproteobacteria bacterium]
MEELGALDRALAEGGPALVHFKRALEDGTQRQHAAFTAGCPVTRLVEERARLIDGLLVRAWTRNLREWSERLALVAVGGYGRGQLHPGSDIDVMVLTDSANLDTAPWRTHIADFVTMLWDLGLEVGHSVRTPEQCVTESQADVTVVTSLMESRLLHGPLTLFEKMRELTDPDHVWPSRAFFEAKLQEQKARHLRYHDTGYNLEPNVKGSPGGLRDIQLVGWVAKRHFGAETLQDLVAEGFLTEPEFEGLIEGREFLWKLRYALHALTGRREDRLLFDHQLALAEQLGYKDSPHTLAVEHMMQRYY